jgi:hypothetical protein
MAAGSVQTVVVCSSTGSVGVGGVGVSCGTDASGNALYLSTVQGYVIDPAYSSYIDSVASSFDYTQAFGFWGVAFTSVVGLYFASKGIGTVLSFIRRV